MPLVKCGGRWVSDRTQAVGCLIPVLSLGRRVVATEGVGQQSGTYSVAEASVIAGGPVLRAISLYGALFDASAMDEVRVDLMIMKVAELKDELAARGESKSGNKAWLRRRLHASILHRHLEAEDA